MKPFVIAAAAVLGLAGVACASEDSGDAIEVVGSDTACDAAETDFEAGKITFSMKNEGDKVTELYVYGENDKVISEVENVGPGTSRNLTVDLKAGEYELACKPGMTGDGIRVPIKVTGEGGEQSAEEAKADREVELEAVEYKFNGIDGFTAKAGETIEFKMANKGAEEHEFEILDADDKALGEVEPVKPGEEGEAYISFAKAGTYTYICDIEDHAAKGMKGTFTVT